MIQWTESISRQPLLGIQISPRGFKASLKTFLEVLRELEISATLWVKLPQGAAWLEDLKHYSRSVTPAPQIYLLSRRPVPTADWYTPVPLANNFSLRGEYQLLMVAAEGAALFSARRQPGEEGKAGANGAALNEPVLTSLATVNLSFTFQRSLLQQALLDMKSLLQAVITENPERSDLVNLLSDWSSQFSLPDQLSPSLVDALMMMQWQQHERLCQQAKAYRRQAVEASSLSTQNEALLNTLRLKDNFLNTVGQELRTPLSTIKTALPLLASPNLKPPQRQRYLDMISQQCDRQRNLISGVLALLQIEMSLASVTPEPVQLFDIVPGVVSTYQPIAQEKGIRLAYTVPDTLPRACCPETWLRQIVIQLLNNGIKYSPAGGTVWVTASAENDEWVVLDIKDSGVGIPPQDLPHIFEHFYRGRQVPHEEEGAGLGLTIVQQLLLYCGGRIAVESQPGIGSYFQVKLPIYHSSSS
jgi:two-component system phosphate regulon sensor histidine kinase PhoR